MEEKKCVGLKERIEYNEDFKLDWHDPDEATDGYQLKWIGKDYARLQSGMQTETVIIPDTSHNDREENKNSENLFFTGDNLEVLRHLQNAYSNSIKMIYIDPPYNTGGEFVYNDKFEYTDEQLKEMLGITDEEIKRLHTINGRSSHSAWLTFMYPRLKIARKLLKEDGVIFISVDDNEQSNLKLLCDEIFGENSFISQFPWRKRTAKSDVPFGVSQDYEWVISYAKTSQFKASIEGKPRKYYETEDFPNRPWRIHDMTKQTTASERPNSFFTMVNPKNGDEYPADPNRTWRITKDTFQKYYDNNEIIFPGDYDFLNISKPVARYFKDKDMEKDGDDFGRVALSTKLPDNIGMYEDGTKEIKDIFGYIVFPFPKTTNFIKYFINAATRKDDIILDFFSGSSTTAHAVMQLNADEKNGTRKFIMVQLPEATKEQSEARKNGFNTIDEIGRKRIELASKKIKEETNADIDYGFKHYYVKEPNVNTINKITEFDPQNNTFIADDMVNEFDNDYSKGKEVVLTTWLVSDGYKLNQEVKEIDFCGYKAHYIDNSFLYLIDNNWNKEQTKDLLNKIGERKININTIIVYGYSFTMESLRELETNIKQNFDNKIQIEKRY